MTKAITLAPLLVQPASQGSSDTADAAGAHMSNNQAFPLHGTCVAPF